MNRRAVAAGGAALLLLVTSLSAGSAALAASSELSPTGEEAFSQLSSCIASDDTKTVKVQFLVDESRSLRENDPDDKRVQALNSAVGTLADLDSQLEQVGKSVEASGATFAERYRERLPWSDLTQNRAAIDDFVRATAEYDQGGGTNYVAALDGSRQAFDSASADTCRVVFWFTDGKLDMDFAGAEQDDDAAWDALSSVGGLADALRRDGITVVALPLFAESAPDDLKAGPLDRARLQAIAEGDGASAGATATAGTPLNELPKGSSAGAYLESGDPAELAGYFTYAVARSTGYSDAGTIECPSDECPGGVLPVDVEPGIADTQVLFFPKGQPGSLSVRDPKGTTVLESQPGNGSSVSASGAEVSIRWDGGLAVVDISQGSDSEAAGTWSIQTDPSRPTQARILLRSGLRVSLPSDRPPLIAGQPTQFDLTITQADGTPVRPEVYLSFSVDAGLDSLSPAEPAGQGVYQTTVTAGEVSGQAQLRADVGVVTRNGTRLDALRPAFDLPVAPPDGFPTAKLLPFPLLEGVTQGTTTLELTNTSDQETSVTVRELSFESPDGSTKDDVTLAGVQTGQPITLPPGETKQFEVSFTPSQSLDGVAHGVITVELDSGQPGQPTLSQEIPFDIQLARPVNEPLRWVLALLLALLSLVIPVAMLYVIGRRQARFRVDGRLSAVDVEAQFDTRTGRITATTGGPFRTDPNDWRRMPIEGPTRQFNFGSLGFRGCVGARPNRGAFIPRGEVTVERGVVVVPDSLRFSGLGVSGVSGATSELTFAAREDPTWFLHIPYPEQLRSDALSAADEQASSIPVRVVGFSGTDIARFDAAVNGWGDGSDLLKLLQDRLPPVPNEAPGSSQAGHPRGSGGDALPESPGGPPPPDWDDPGGPATPGRGRPSGPPPADWYTSSGPATSSGGGPSTPPPPSWGRSGGSVSPSGGRPSGPPPADWDTSSGPATSSGGGPSTPPPSGRGRPSGPPPSGRGRPSGPPPADWDTSSGPATSSGGGPSTPPPAGRERSGGPPPPAWGSPTTQPPTTGAVPGQDPSRPLSGEPGITWARFSATPPTSVSGASGRAPSTPPKPRRRRRAKTDPGKGPRPTPPASDKGPDKGDTGRSSGPPPADW